MAAFTLIQVHYEFDFNSYGPFCAGLVSRQPVRVGVKCYLFIQHIAKIWRNFDETVMNNITGNSRVNFYKKFKVFQGISRLSPKF